MLHPDELKLEKKEEKPEETPKEAPLTPIFIPEDLNTISTLLKNIIQKADGFTGDKEKRQFQTMNAIMTRIMRNRKTGVIEQNLRTRDREPVTEPTGPVTEDHIKLKKAQLGIEALASSFKNEREKAIFLGTRGALSKLVAAKVPSDCKVEPVKTFEEANALLKSLTKGFIVDQREVNKITSATQMLTGYIAKKQREKQFLHNSTVGKHRFGNSGFRGRGFKRGGFRGRGFRGQGHGFHGRGGSDARGRGRGRGRAHGRGRGRGRGGRPRGGNFGFGRDNNRNQESSFAGPRDNIPQRRDNYRGGFGRGQSFQTDGRNVNYDQQFSYERNHDPHSKDWL